MKIAVVFALLMFTPADLENPMEFMITDGLSKCLKAKREAERNLSENRENVIQYRCGQVVAELRPDSEGNMKIYKIIEHKY